MWDDIFVSVENNDTGVWWSLGLKSSQDVLLGDLRRGRGMMKGCRCARLSENPICLHNRFVNSLVPTNIHWVPIIPKAPTRGLWVYKGERTCFLHSEYLRSRGMHYLWTINAMLYLMTQTKWHWCWRKMNSHCDWAHERRLHGGGAIWARKGVRFYCWRWLWHQGKWSRYRKMASAVIWWWTSPEYV